MWIKQEWRNRLTIVVLVVAIGGALFAFLRPEMARVASRTGEAEQSFPVVPSEKTAIDRHTDVTAQPTVSDASGSVSFASSTDGVRPSAPANLNKYPGSLGAQADTALEAKNGLMALDVASILAECESAIRLEEDFSRRATGKTSAEVQAVSVQRSQERQRFISSCQTVVGGHDAMRVRLLDLALEQHVVGAAVDIYADQLRRPNSKQKPEVLNAMVADAFAGDVKSLVFVAAQGTSTFGLTLEQQQVLRYGFELAAKDREVGKTVSTYLATSDSLSAALTDTRFDTSKLSDATRTEGRLIASKILARVRASS